MKKKTNIFLYMFTIDIKVNIVCVSFGIKVRKYGAVDSILLIRL